jgi:H+/Cl- antiporter ClcA
MEVKPTRANLPNWKSLFVSALCGVFAGISSTLLLLGLNWATFYENHHAWLIGLLPVGGFFLGWIFYRFGKPISGGSNLILQEIHDPANVLPFRMAPLVWLGNVVSLLFGASVGREGTAVQMSASLADQISRPLRLGPENRRALLVASAGAGFGSALGAPIAGALFGMEVIRVGRLRPFAIVDCLMASFVGYGVAKFLGSPHAEVGHVRIPHLSFFLVFAIIALGPIFGWIARAFAKVTHLLETLFAKAIPYPPFRPLLGGLLLVGLYSWESSYRFVGLGLPVISGSFKAAANFDVPFWKFILTALSLGAGFRGGEFVPLVFIGSTFGSAASATLRLSTPFISALGFVSVFAGAANTPLTCSIMAGELFGWKMFPYALVCTYLSYYFSGNRGIYHGQKKSEKKTATLKKILLSFGEIPRRFF